MSLTKSMLSAVALVLVTSGCLFDSKGSGTAVSDTDDSETDASPPADTDDSDSAANTDADDSDTAEAEFDCEDPGRYYRDADDDGFGDPAMSRQACDAPTGYVANDADCDDGRMEANPEQLEACDGFDNDCDGGIDEFSTTNAECGSCSWDIGPGGADAFAHCDEKLDWEEARAACVAFGGDLAVVSSAPVHAFVHQFALDDPWIGLADLDEEGRWFWVDGQEAMTGGVSVGFDGWQSSQPDGAGGEDCGLLVQTKGWADANCSEAHAFACQLPL